MYKMNDAQYPATPEIPRINVAPSQASFNVNVKVFLEKASDYFSYISDDSDSVEIPPHHTLYCGLLDRRNSAVNGPGTAILSPDKMLEGVFDSSVNFGKACKVTDTEQAAIISGEYEAGCFNGLGELTTPDIQYKGTIVNDRVIGSGRLLTSQFSYSGEFSDSGKRDGLGELIIGNRRYVGSFSMDLPHGKCKVFTDNAETGVSTVFEGEFVRGREHGEGRLTNTRGEEWFVLYENGELKERQPYHVKTIKDLTEKVDILTAQCENSADITCKVCMAEPSNVVTVPCGHLVLCQRCEHTLAQTQSRKCPFCRSHYRSIIKVVIPS